MHNTHLYAEHVREAQSSRKVSKQKRHGMHSNRQLRCSERLIYTHIYTKLDKYGPVADPLSPAEIHLGLTNLDAQ